MVLICKSSKLPISWVKDKILTMSYRALTLCTWQTNRLNVHCGYTSSMWPLDSRLAFHLFILTPFLLTLLLLAVSLTGLLATLWTCQAHSSLKVSELQAPPLDNWTVHSSPPLNPCSSVTSRWHLSPTPKDTHTCSDSQHSPGIPPPLLHFITFYSIYPFEHSV